MRPWLALLRTPGIGSRTFSRLLEQAGTPRQILLESRQSLSALGLTERMIDSLRNPDWVNVEQDLVWLAEPNRRLLTLHDPEYPSLLREIPDPPPLLFILGDPIALTTPQLAMVGSRNPSKLGTGIAHDFAKCLAGAGITITSGLALGIDAASHRGALNGAGTTVAVAGTGLDRIYPARHKDLAFEIVDHGALTSEFPPGTAAQPNHFPRRNRIIS
ncbi:MAG: DNA-processing protein DprA, partial [Pseudomonadota bacterium]